MRTAIASLLFLLMHFCAQAQNPKDSVCPSPILSMTYAFQVPTGTLAERFGNAHTIGAGFHYKTRKNWMIGVTGHYIFGEDVKNIGELLGPILTTSGIIIGRNGVPAVVNLSEKGYMLSADVGKLFTAKWLAPNPNSGIMVRISGGFMAHWIGIDVQENTVPQLDGDYEAGYDRLTGGPMLQEYIGYHFQSGNRLLNFYGGFEFTQAFTNTLRSFDYSSRTKLDQQRVDLLFGFRIGWMIPFYKRDQQQYYNF